jgi:hypothetical protein
MHSLERGGIWAELDITNFLEGDIFAWYLSSWNDDIADVVRQIVGRLDGYDPRTLSVDTTDSRDLLKQLYQHLFPKPVRHDLGEYYTPDWLANEVLDAIGYDGNPDKRLLDPACGSGTFIVLAINRIKRWYDQNRDSCGFDESELVKRILSNIVGFDLNPLAVMAARTNFLLAIRDLLKFAGGAEIPVYLCDSILVPIEYGDLFTKAEVGKVKRLPTAVGDFRIPNEIAKDPDSVAKYAETIELCLRNCTGEEFVEQCRAEGLTITENDLHIQLFVRLQELDKADAFLMTYVATDAYLKPDGRLGS